MQHNSLYMYTTIRSVTQVTCTTSSMQNSYSWPRIYSWVRSRSSAWRKWYKCHSVGTTRHRSLPRAGQVDKFFRPSALLSEVCANYLPVLFRPVGIGAAGTPQDSLDTLMPRAELYHFTRKIGHPVPLDGVIGEEFLGSICLEPSPASVLRPGWPPYDTRKLQFCVWVMLHPMFEVPNTAAATNPVWANLRKTL